MKTRSLILQDYEVRAALDGRLGLVVRPVKGLGDIEFTSVRLSSFNSIWGPDAWIFEMPLDKDVTGAESMSKGLQCPLGVLGTRLVCKETWAWSGDASIPEPERLARDEVWFSVDSILTNPAIRWRSPATMPGWASRITLEVQGVRCVRPVELTNEDAFACGFEWAGGLKEFWNAKYAPRYPWESSWAWAVGVRRAGI